MAYNLFKAAKNAATRVEGAVKSTWSPSNSRTGTADKIAETLGAPLAALFPNRTAAGQNLFNIGAAHASSYDPSKDPSNPLYVGNAFNKNAVTNPQGAGPIQSQTGGAITQNQSGATGSTGGTGGAGNLVEYPAGSGFYYDLNDPTQRQSFFDAKLTDLNKSHTDALTAIQQNIQALQDQARGYVNTYNQNINGLNQAKQGGDISRLNAFNQASPDAFQSSEVNSYNVGNKAYLDSLGNAAKQAQQDVGANFLANPNDFNQLGGSYFGQQLNTQNQNINDANNQFNTFLAGINQQNDAQNSPYKFIYQNAGQNVPKPVDLTGNIPAVNFVGATAGQVPTNAFNAVGGADPFTKNTNYNAFLGSNSGLSGADNQYLQNYLLGNSS